MIDPRSEYEQRRSDWSARIARYDRRHGILANLRLATSLVAVVLAVLAARGSVSVWWLSVPAAVFAALVVVHARLLERADRARRAQRLYDRGVERVAGGWAGLGRDGAAFTQDHAYARDLDLFGPASVFQRLNTARTDAGDRVLASWLSAPAALAEVRARQQAVDELRPNLRFREDLAVLADDAAVVDTARLTTWARAQPIGFPSIAPILCAASGAVTVGLAAAAWRELVPWSLFIGWLLVEFALVFAWRRLLHGVMFGIDLAERDLSPLVELLERIESERFDAAWLVARQRALVSDGLRASRAITRLRQLVSLLESSTHNLLFAPVTHALLVPEQLVMSLARWHAAHGRVVEDWLRAAGELEAVASLAAYAFERPADPFPELVDTGTVFDARDLGHPLIADPASVRNDVRLGGDAPHVLVVSGSNMSGKSTLLRAVGVNTVLALAGAPVRASSLRVSWLAMGATLRVDDSLQEHRSRFFAEILRIRGIVEIARAGSPLLFLLDEILHGTNSYDRRLGAEAIVRGLVSQGAIGLITTHDLALTELVATLGPAAANVHFEDRLDAGRMVFDYRMRPGVVEHSNALALMRAVGLDV